MKIAYSTLLLASWIISFEGFSKPRSCPICPAEKNGDVVHRGSKMIENFPGHAGIFLDGVYLHVNPDFDSDEAALRTTSLDGFLAGNKFWGAKRHKNTPLGLSSNQVTIVQNRIEIFKEFGMVYDSSHLHQKGVFIPNDYTRGKTILKTGYYQFDCVGFTEHLYEYIGLDFTPDSDEKMFLTPKKQSESPNAIHTPTRL